MYFSLEEATKGTQYAASINPFQQVKKSRGALTSIKQQSAGVDKWQAKPAQRDKFLHSAEWKCQILYPLKRCVGKHRGAYISMKGVTEH
eukprot:14332408-Ditylum_brightwellii.AAC.1